jgi:molecular chaperone DnaJ
MTGRHERGESQPGDNPQEEVNDSGFSDLFETFFGDAGGGRVGAGTRAQRGADRRAMVTPEFREAVFGVEREIEVERLEVCEHCRGRRAEPGTGSETCPTCRGTGELRRAQQTAQGQFVSVSACERCRGEGRIITTPCTTCRGEGRVRAQRAIAVSIPAGVDDGNQMRLTGRGDAGVFGGPAGNLLVYLSVKPDLIFTRQGHDLLVDLPITSAQAAQGVVVTVPTLDEPAILHVPAGTQSGRRFRLHHRGVPRLRGDGRGDLWVTIYVAAE